MSAVDLLIFLLYLVGLCGLLLVASLIADFLMWITSGSDDERTD